MSRRRRGGAPAPSQAPPGAAPRRVGRLGVAGAVTAVVVVSVGAIWLWRSTGTAPAGPRPNILLITLDTTRADRIGAYGYREGRTPRLDRLASEGTLFERALTAAPTTLPAHTSLLTGRSPWLHQVRNNGFPLADTVPTLESALHEAGYRTGAFVSSFVLDRRFGLARGFDVYNDALDPNPGAAAELVERRGDRTAAAALAWMAAQSGGSAPFLAWVHLYDPHDPYGPPAPFRDAFAGRPYDGEIAFVDGVVGSLLDALERSGVGASTVVAIVGDHGESLGDHGEATHGMFVYDADMRVPFILRWAGHVPAGRRVSPLVRSIDVAPTLLDLAGRPPLAGADGSSLMPLVRGRSAGPGSAYGETFFPLLFMNWSPLRSIRDERWKYIEAPEPELYDLSADPGELDNLAAHEPARAAALQRALDALAQERSGAPLAGAPSRDTIERLAALGYVGLQSTLNRSDALKRPDPKRLIAVFNRLRDANAAVLQGRLEEAAAVARAVLADDRRNAFAMLILAKADMGQGRYGAAARGLQQYLDLVPTSADAHQWLAVCRLQEGDERAALREVDAALAIDARFADARALRGGLLAVAGRREEAIGELRAAVDLNPDRAAFRVSLGRELFKASRFDEAEGQFARARELQPANAEAHGGYAAALVARGRAAEAVPAFAQALELSPERDEVRLDYARALEKAGRRQEADAEFRRLASGKNVAPAIRAAARAGLTKQD